MKMDKPQIIAHIEKSVDYSLFDCRWMPCSAKFVVLGSMPNSSGVIQLYEISGGSVKMIKEIKREKAFKCCTFGGSKLSNRLLATGDFDGRLNLWDFEKPENPACSFNNAHKEIINCIDGVGGLSTGCGAPEIVTGSRDGSVKVWDPRQRDKPVAVMEPEEGESKRDCWAVGFGNSYNSEERVVCAGYDNGDIKMFDLKNMSLRWETNIKNGICGLEFDRRDIKMNKLVATTLESKVHVFYLRTQHSKEGHKSTVWLTRHLPQNREIFMTGGGSGSLCLWKYNYPEKRTKMIDGEEAGVAGNLTLLQNATLSSQPICGFDWSPDKQGLAVCTSFDQAFRVLIVTKLNLY
ncbi:hypothetical protein FOCC_FOCC013075 [Frankliniella occidentalis]|nr:hypothetical protein FOCC_FOCC013075 [Frankliniella occidentalis]